MSADILEKSKDKDLGVVSSLVHAEEAKLIDSSDG